MNVPSLKNRKPVVYVFLSLYLFFGVFFLALSCVPGSASASESNWVGNVLASFLNLFEDTSPTVKVQPTSLSLTSDSTYLNVVDSSLAKPQIALGTTTMLQFKIGTPNSLNKGEYVDPSFSVVRNDDSTKEDYDFNIDSGHAVVRIISTNLPMDNCSITVKAGSGESEATSYTYNFSIVENPAPVNYDASLSVSSLRPNSSAQIALTLKDELGHDDNYLRRYYDPSKLDYSPKDGGCYLDEFGVIHAKSVGDYTLHYGTFQSTIRVEGNALPLPSEGDLRLEKTSSSIRIQDYDYADAGTTLSAIWASSYLGDKGITWVSSDPLICRLIPSQDGQSCVAKGYRKAGEVTVSAISNADPNLKQSVTLSSSPSVPNADSWHLLYANGKKELASSLTAHSAGNIVIYNSYDSALFHISNNNLVGTSDFSGIVISGSGTPYLTLSFQQTGKGNVKIVSEGNPDCSFELAIDVQSELNQDPDDPTYQVSVRKVVGHFGWFLLGGALGYLFFSFFLAEVSKKEWIPLLLSTLSGAFFAFLSEGIQYFIPGRGASFADSGIDIGGYVLGGLLAFLVMFLVRSHRQKKGSVSAPEDSAN
jgi:VanZ family protein